MVPDRVFGVPGVVAVLIGVVEGIEEVEVGVVEVVEEATVNAVSLERSARLQATVASLGAVREIPPKELNDESLTLGLTLHEYVEAQWDYWSLEANK